MPERDMSPIWKVLSIWKLLPSHYRRHFLLVLCLTSLGGLLEMLGLSLIVPLLGIISNPDHISENRLFSYLFSLMGNPGYEPLVFYSASIILIFYIFKAVFIGFTNLAIAHYTFNIKAYVRSTLFKKYLYMPNIDRANYHSSLLLANVTTTTNIMVVNGFLPAFTLIAEGTVFLAIGFLLFIYSPLNTLYATAIIFIAMFFYEIIIKRRIQLWSKRRALHEDERLKSIQEAIAVNKEIYLLGRQEYFVEKFNNSNTITAYSERNNHALNQIPRLWLETIGVIILTLIVIVAINSSTSSSDTIPILALFAAASFKLLPAANRILANIQSLKFGDSALEKLLAELSAYEAHNLRDQQKKSKIHFKDKIEIINMSYRYPDDDRFTLKDISLTINKGDSIGIIGESGAGKSTLVNLLLGILTPDEGCILIDGINIQKAIRSWQNKVGFVPQEIFLLDDSLRKNIALGIDSADIDELAIKRSIDLSQMDKLINSMPNGMDSMIGERGDKLSGGEKQRIGIARALYHNPEVLIFDEATSALDSLTEEKIMRSIERLKKDKTLIFITHRPSTIENCNKVFRILNGKIETVRS